MSRRIFVFLTVIYSLFGGMLACATDLADINLKTNAGQTVLELAIPVDEKPNVFMIANDNPRIVIDLKDANLSQNLIKRAEGNSFFPGAGGIAKLRFAKRGKKDLRLVADLLPGANLISNSFESGTLSIILDSGPNAQIAPITPDDKPKPRIKPVQAAEMTTPERPAQPIEPIEPIESIEKSPDYVEGIPVPSLKSKLMVRKYRMPVIVIDPGHGGYDPGAIGRKKVKEEVVTLAAAKELRSQLLATGRYTVVLTRNKDVYIAHEERVRIARKAGANLFISIHADSTSKSTTRGASVYTLADRAQKRSQEVIGTQNWILDVDLSDQSEQVGDILVDLAQRKTLTKSAQFADMLLPELAKHSALVGNSHRRAGYYVLLAPDVPAVLLEMGFLSNEKDERLINSPHHRKNLMKSVVAATNGYFATQRQLQASR
jgi:N-acetylmuramoyl-L-alanine amidase